MRARSKSDSSIESPLPMANGTCVGESPLAVSHTGSSSAATCVCVVRLSAIYSRLFLIKPFRCTFAATCNMTENKW